MVHRGKKDSEADRAKEEAWAAQQELLERRRSGAAIEVSEAGTPCAFAFWRQRP